MSAFPIPAPLAYGPQLTKVRHAPDRASDASGFASEMLGFPARWLTALPAPPSLTLHVPGVEGMVRVETDGLSEKEGAAGEAASVRFSADEWGALCRGIEADRIWPADLRAICARKAANPAYRLEQDEALAGAQVDKNETWALQRVLDRVDAHLILP